MEGDVTGSAARTVVAARIANPKAVIARSRSFMRISSPKHPSVAVFAVMRLECLIPVKD
jgi:hypothetical protein